VGEQGRRSTPRGIAAGPAVAVCALLVGCSAVPEEGLAVVQGPEVVCEAPQQGFDRMSSAFRSMAARRERRTLCALAMTSLLIGCAPTPSEESTALPACAAPTGGPGALIDALPGSGITFEGASRLGGDGLPFMIDQVLGALGAGVVAADLDNDGHVDLLFTQDDGANALYWGEGDATFIEATDAGVGFPDARTFGASTADFDGDGLLDLALSQLYGARVLRNRGDRTFEDVSDSLGMTNNDGAGTTTAWADIDGDGDLDLYSGFVFTDIDDDQDPPVDPSTFVPSTGRDDVWRNDGDAFVDIQAFVTPRGNDGGVLHAMWTDWDDDGDPDLIQGNDGEMTVNSFLWEHRGFNDDGTWTPYDRLPETDLGLISSPMGFSIADLNADGRRDLVFSSKGPARSLRATEPWRFIDMGPLWNGALPAWPSVSWSVIPLDLDGDGDPGLYVTYGPLTDVFMTRDPDEETGPDAAWRRQPDHYIAPAGSPGERTFVDANEVFPTPQDENSRGAAVSDINEDGVPDLVIANLNGPPALLLGACTAAHRLVVALRDPSTANRFGIGSKVTVTAGGVTRFAEMVAGGPGSFSGSDPVLFFGLGDAERVERVEVRWPGGATQVITDVCADCRIVIPRE